MQSQDIATVVNTLKQQGKQGAQRLSKLKTLHKGSKEGVEELRARLAAAEEEMAVLRQQAQRAALLEVQNEVAAQLVEDLTVCLCASSFYVSESCSVH